MRRMAVGSSSTTRAASQNMVFRVLVALGTGSVTALVVGIPTGIIETSWYSRMTPVLWWNYPVWVVSAVLTGALVATYVRVPEGVKLDQQSKTFGGSLLAFLAVGCPICNKIVILALGVNGALTWFAPAQPVIALASLGLLAFALRSRVRAFRSCPLPVAG